MHILMLVAIGLVVLAAFYFAAGLVGQSGHRLAFAFIWVWLVAALVNGAVGVLRFGIPIVNELGAFIAIFGIPAAAAWYLASRGAPAR